MVNLTSKIDPFSPKFKTCRFLSMVIKLLVDSVLQFSNSFNSPPFGFTVTFKSVSETLANHNAMPVMQESAELLAMMSMAQKNGTKGLC